MGQIRHMTLGKISDRDMRDCHFVKLTRDIEDSPSRAPLLYLKRRASSCRVNGFYHGNVGVCSDFRSIGFSLHNMEVVVVRGGGGHTPRHLSCSAPVTEVGP